jgi:glycosyltransferase involved in cell wall biosynthesis
LTEAIASPGEKRPAPDLSRLRVLITHEWLYAWAGAERCLEQIMRTFPQADLLVGMITPEMRDFNDVTRRGRETWVGKLPGARSAHRWFLPLHAAAFALEDTSPYDLVVSSSHAFEKFIRPRRGAKHLCYCYSPPRFVWGMQQEYAEHGSVATRMALAASAPLLRALDRGAARNVDKFVSISRHVAERVRGAYGVESEVVYPPATRKVCDPAMPRVAPREPFLLFLGRLVEYKRVDLVVRAAEQLAMKLVVAGDGPMRPALERIAGPHTEFRGAVSEPEAADLLSNCDAFVFAGEEDFGISLVEANAHERPVVCYAGGGAAETMIAGETAVTFRDQTVGAVVGAIETCLQRSWDAAALRRNAARFSPDEFQSNFRRVVQSVLSGA